MVLPLLKNFFSLVGAEAFSKVATFAAFAYLARIYGPTGFGYIEWASAVLMCASLIVDQGFSAYGAREIAKSPKLTERLVAEVVTARFFLAAVGYLIVAVCALWFVHEQIITRLLLIYGLSLWLLPLMLQWVFQGHDRMYLVSLTQMIRQIVFVGAIFILVRNVNDLLFVGVAEVAGVLCAAVFSVWMYRRNFASRIRLSPSFSTKLLREGTPIGLSQMFWVVKMFGATLIVGFIATSEDTGYFASAMRILIALHTFVWLYYFNLLPSLSRAWEQGSEKFSALIRSSMRIVVPISLLSGLVWVLLSRFVMTDRLRRKFFRRERRHCNGWRALAWRRHSAGTFVSD